MDHHHDQTVPRGALLGAAALILATFAFAAQARMGAAADSSSTELAVRASIDLRFEDRADGSVAVLDAATDQEIDVVPPAEGGFIRGVMRGMNRTRMLESVSRHDSYRLLRLADGALVLDDPQSGRRVDLRSFGDTNYQSFARLLEDESR